MVHIEEGGRVPSSTLSSAGGCRPTKGSNRGLFLNSLTGHILWQNSLKHSLCNIEDELITYFAQWLMFSERYQELDFTEKSKSHTLS